MKLVLDTNVIVSGFLSPHGAPAQILYRVTQGEFQLLYDVRMLQEYRDVLARKEFDLPADAVQQFLKRVEEEGHLIIPRPLAHRLPDLDDEPFLEVALEAGAKVLVTGNLRHFPKSACGPVSVLSPNALLDRLRKS